MVQDNSFQRAPQPELIGHDVFAFWCVSRCPNIAGILAADEACQKRERFSLSGWQMQWRMGYGAGTGSFESRYA